MSFYLGYRYLIHISVSVIQSEKDHIHVLQNNSKLLSGSPWPINGNTDNNLESLCTFPEDDAARA
jgi:hypothetical protein